MGAGLRQATVIYKLASRPAATAALSCALGCCLHLGRRNPTGSSPRSWGPRRPRQELPQVSRMETQGWGDGVGPPGVKPPLTTAPCPREAPTLRQPCGHPQKASVAALPMEAQRGRRPSSLTVLPARLQARGSVRAACGC